MKNEERINLKGLEAAMEAAGIDVLVGASSENFFYLTDTLLLSHEIIPERLCMVVMPSEGVPWALVCYCEEVQTRQDSWIKEVHTYQEFQESPMEALARLLKEQGWGRSRIGVEKRFLAGRYVEELAALLPEATLLAGGRAFDQARSLKTPQEIEILRAAALETERAILDSFNGSRPGDSEKEVADRISTRLLTAGGTSSWIVLAAGANTAINHPWAGSKRLEPGEIVRVDTGASFNGYRSDVARTAVVGEPSREQRALYRKLREVELETISRVRAGTRACQVYEDFVGAFQRRGLGVTSKAVGHSLGTGMHEYPILNGKEGAELTPGMVLCIEPAVLDSSGFLYHVEDLVLVTEGEPRILTGHMNADDLFVIT